MTYALISTTVLALLAMAYAAVQRSGAKVATTKVAALEDAAKNIDTIHRMQLDSLKSTVANREVDVKTSADALIRAKGELEDTERENARLRIELQRKETAAEEALRVGRS